MKIIHERYSKKSPLRDSFRDLFDTAKECGSDVGKELRTLVDAERPQEDLHPLRVLELFKRIPDSDCLVLDTDPINGRPESLLITSMIVPPGCLRPSIAEDTVGGGGSNEDPLSMILSDILNCNEVIESQLRGPPNKVRNQ